MHCTQPTRERVHLYWIKTKEFRASGHLDNGLRRLLSYYWPKISVETVSSFQVQYWRRGQLRSQMGNQDWWVHEIWLISGQPNFVTSIPGWCIWVAQEIWLLQIFPHERVQSRQCCCFLWWNQWSWPQNSSLWLIVCVVMSVTKGAYFLLFLLCRCLLLVWSWAEKYESTTHSII